MNRACWTVTLSMCIHHHRTEIHISMSKISQKHGTVVVPNLWGAPQSSQTFTNISVHGLETSLDQKPEVPY